MQRPAETPGPARPRADICILLNPGSGKKKRAVLASIDAAMDRHPGRFELRVLKKGQDIAAAAQAAVDDGFPVLAAAGGDGTIAAVAGVVHGAGRTLGLLPSGTFNFFARGLDVPEETDAALDLLARGPTRAMPVAEVNGKLFLNNASLGLYPAILAVREGTYRRWGRSRLAAHWSMIVTFVRFHRPLALRVVIDGEEVRRRTPIAFVARSAFQLDFYGLDGVEAVRSGGFALFLAPEQSRWALFRFALRLAWGAAEAGRDYDVFTGQSIDIETAARRRLVARDGEREKMTSPFRFRIRPTDLTVIAPPES